MEEHELAERVAILETQMQAVLTFDRRITRLERSMWFVAGVASVSGMSAAPQLVTALTT